ncbi:hypothetical protein QVD17_28012 [Tagetes erecta]|uniref:Glycosyltransferase n=1 Tax=Tagetes erecta TaxID=13708 RepID=A0AAD8NRP8_TARER|nr:hypothetical protein QVD17_28012 [Tagetes erecta]
MISANLQEIPYVIDKQNQRNMGSTIAELIFIPSPDIGHFVSAVEMAKLLVNRDQRLSITILVIRHPGASAGPVVTPIDRISFVQLPQESPSVMEPKSPFAIFTKFIPSHCKHVTNVVADMINQPRSVPIAGFVIDMFCACMIDVANEFNIPTYLFFTSGAAALGFKFHVQTLSDDMNKDVFELSTSDTEISVPTYVNPLPTKHFWNLVRSREGVEFVLSSARKFRGIKAIMVNTVFELETYAMEALSADKTIPRVYPVGPVLNLNGKPFEDDILRWLDNQPPSSVVFLCFGSMGSFVESQVKEIARGLEQSGYRFLWSLRRPPPDKKPPVPGEYEDPSVVLPEGFLERTREIGKVIGWAPQVAALAHDAVGGFVSHCGWNSVLESLWFGVPLAAWPMYAEQQMNAFEMVVDLGLAVEIKLDYKNNIFNRKDTTNATSNVTAKEIENGIRRVMEDKEVRTKVKETSAKSRSAVAEGGSSYASVSSLIEDFIKNVN